ncbi:vascular-related unknown protein 1-like [Impatiens glandulifera]|uniref:vascular-related unknown protein 1-like n=1 Tax=Impatiens glandulifera TaxID=253017 RepID=UPI001FB0CE22|nr:vascular-related unknown protein 1-like [Impatiens glandulifera]
MADSSRFSSAMKDAEIEDQEPEESGWTSYFEDFEMMNQRDDQKEKIGNSYSNNSNRSIVSGDVSSAAAAWKIITAGTSQTPPPKKLNLRKKTRTEKVSDFDDSLEDTATSPVSSPKMGSLMKTKMKARGSRYHDNTGSPLGKEEAGNKEGNEKKYGCISNIDNDEYEDLQKRGLCLVPFSMFSNYIG